MANNPIKRTQIISGDGTTPHAFSVQPNSRRLSPTFEVSAEWQARYSYFNARLFGGILPDCIITFTKHPLAQGYFCAEAFRDRDGLIAHEIAMNPAWFALGDMESFATLVHEMCHLWRHVFGPRNRKGGYGAPGYHDRPWADKMEAIGLMPSDTGKPGGKRTGFHMRDYPIEGGAFDLACRELLIGGDSVNWRDAREFEWVADPFAGTGTPAGENPMPPRRSKSTRTRFECAGCGLKAWAKPSARLSCRNCNRPLTAS
ncbi:sprT domain-containing protein [Nitratireductor sp. CAU 1489]|uniref:SprT domain-containing protein n=1 Tax=Nitratireductor arenosus TaxID=2682096 RepID=A0A844QIX1_9HYPH|nr:sprT domain-containing protein [Nitratireductor arenosus]MVA97998.1 sprT domain-containing protein [Nitratireductor arenosus]